MRETITVQVGQCGNQIGSQFWTKLLAEHETTPDTDAALGAFFRFSNSKSNRKVMKARALLIDMETGPLHEVMKSPISSLFDETQFVMDVYGAGNNFAHGHYEYGPKYRNQFEEGLRRNAEHCDSLQTFIVTHSLSGGTGSGVGTYILSLIHDLYPEVYRFSACVFPSEDNDVVTAPYNSTLATNELVEHADCVLPIDNFALQSFVKLETVAKQKSNSNNSSQTTDTSKQKGFDEMNEVAARMLCHLTSSSRFHGDMNVDMNEICTNLVPYPRLHFLMTAMNPYRPLSSSTNSMHFGNRGTTSNPNKLAASKQIENTRNSLRRCFSDILCKNGQITAADPSSLSSVTIATAFLARGNVGPLSDYLSCVTSAKKVLRFPSWNQDAFKIGICNTPSPGQHMNVLGVYNNTSFGSTLHQESKRFNMLYRRQAMLHHYTQFVDSETIGAAGEMCANIINEYAAIERQSVHTDIDLKSKSYEEATKAIRFPVF